MYLKNIPSGKNLPDDVYAIIEISAHSYPVKYEIQKETGISFVDRFILSPMLYPCNYGYINHTLSLDGDPVDILVPTPYPIQSNSVILCRPIGMLNMFDESGEDLKIIAVPHETISPIYKSVKNIDDLSDILRNQIHHFFEHYKDLEHGKWTKIKKWENVDLAKIEIINSHKRFQKKIN